MPRIIVRTQKGPAEVETNGKPIHICRCGLSKNEKGLCDGSHNSTLTEDDSTTYVYDKDLNREEVEMGKGECCGKCGDGCCGDKE